MALRVIVDSPLDIEALSRNALKALVERLLEETAAQKTEIAGLREEIVCLEGLRVQPNLKPRGMEKQANARQKTKQARKQAPCRRGAKSFSIDEDRVIETPHPEGSRLKRYEDYLVQDVILLGHLVRYRCERWIRPDGRSWRADAEALGAPAGAPSGHERCHG